MTKAFRLTAACAALTLAGSLAGGSVATARPGGPTGGPDHHGNHGSLGRAGHGKPDTLPGGYKHLAEVPLAGRPFRAENEAWPSG